MKTTIITTNTQALLNQINVATSFMPKDGDFANKINIEGKEGRVIITASDYNQTVRFNSIQFQSNDLTLDSFNNLTVDGKTILKAVKAIKGAELTLEIDYSKNIVLIEPSE